MAADDRAPLLKHDENEFDPFESSRKNLRKLINSNDGAPSETISISGSASVTTLTELDNIVSVFVVAFDIRSGNVIEWCIPEDTDLDGVEFKAMVSGSHTQDTDFVYFRKDNYYGLACFENMRIQSEIERGCRMKSVGILATSYTTLYRHMQFLETQVRHLLETPGKYMQLKVFYDDRKGVLPLNDVTVDGLRPSPLSTPSTPSRDLLPEMKITHPAGCFSQFLQFFGNQIFVLWKLALLQRRILFFSPPPIGIVCYRVYCACCLGHHNITNIMGQNPQPHFYVNVADIEALENEVSYIACTTEKIFESKTHLYDVYVDNQIVKVNSPGLREILKVSDADKDKAVQLNNQRASHRFEVEELGDEQEFDEEDVFTNFFVEMNDRIFQMLLEISNSQDRQLTSDHMKTMGLDPQGDRSFLMELVEHYGIDVVLMVDNPCCPK